MCRVYLSEEDECFDIPIYIMDSDNEQALLGMDILSLGDFSAKHVTIGNDERFIRFQFVVTEDEWLI